MKCVSERLYGWNQSTATTTSSGDGGGWCDHSSDGLQHDRLRPTSGLQPAVRSDSSSGLQLGAVRLRSRLDTGQSRYSSQCTLCGVVCCHFILIYVIWYVGNTIWQHCAWGLMHINLKSRCMYTSREIYNLELNRLTPWQTIWKLDTYFFFSPHGFRNHGDNLYLFAWGFLLMSFGDNTVSFKSIFWCCSWESNLSPPSCEAEARAII